MHKYHKTYEFDNGYGASVVSGTGTYGADEGLFELAVLHGEQGLCYASEVADDVIGWLTHKDVVARLLHIEALPSNPLCTHERQERT